MHKVDDMRGIAAEFCAQLRILGSNANRTGVQVADAHHDATKTNQRRGGKTKLFRAEQGGDDPVAPGLELTVRLDGDAAAQVVEHERLVSFGEAEFPRHACVLDAGKWRR